MSEADELRRVLRQILDALARVGNCSRGCTPLRVAAECPTCRTPLDQARARAKRLLAHGSAKAN